MNTYVYICKCVYHPPMSLLLAAAVAFALWSPLWRHWYVCVCVCVCVCVYIYIYLNIYIYEHIHV